ncbi:MAG: sensor histidine kinase [Muribaculaceae bacterium]
MTSQSKNRAGITVFIHVIFIVLMFFLPELLHHYNSISKLWHLSCWSFARSAVLIFVFYSNYLIIIPQLLLKRRRWVAFVLFNLAVCLVAALLMRYFGHIEHISRVATIADEMSRPPLALPAVDLASFILRDFILQIMVTALAVAMRLSSKWYDLEQKHQQALVASRETELAGLRQQLNPHFLFNTLNSIYALIEISPEAAQRAVHNLSHMLRYMVYENPEQVELEREIDFIATFVEIMRLRMPDRPINFTVDNQAPGATIVPLVFLAQVENAFKHGNTANHSESIDITIRANEECIECLTVNGIDRKAHRDSGHGVGLSNLRRRLEIIYGDAAALHTDTINNQYITHLIINRS